LKPQKPFRLVWITDPHLGHLFGLTPPEYQIKPLEGAQGSHAKRRAKCSSFQMSFWDWYKTTIQSLQPIDGLVGSGDMVEGGGSKSGGSELISSDLNTQIEMAVRVVGEAKAKRIIMVYGTKYHVGGSDGSTDMEDVIAKEVGAEKIGSHEWLTIYGNTFDIKHKVGSSQVPYGRATAVSREAIWSMLWSERQLTPRANIILRGHVHYPIYIGDPLMGYLAMTGPGLQWSTKYGARECTGMVGCGLVHFDIYPDGKFTFEYHMAKLAEQKTEAIKW